MNTAYTQIQIQDYTYQLPAERIAAFPLTQRDDSKLLVYQNGSIEEDIFKNISTHLPPGAAMVLNNTRVIEARLLFQKPTGGVIEIFCLEPEGAYQDISTVMLQTGKSYWQCLIGGASKWKPGQLLQKELEIGGEKVLLTARYVEKRSDCFVIEFSWQPSQLSFSEVLHAAGAIPLPPYIKREVASADAERYQTIFAQHQGSVAAPTAALHFTEKVFDSLAAKNISREFITLHVGAGTFKPVKAATIGEHEMHAEHFQVSRSTLQHLHQASLIIAVGTTSLRTLESLYWLGLKIKENPELPPTELQLKQWEAYELNSEGISYADSLHILGQYLERHGQEELFCQTSLIIVPGYQFRAAKALVTNFHQPQSTLLLLVAAFIGPDWKKVYQHALENDFRFLSYGDSSLLWRK